MLVALFTRRRSGVWLLLGCLLLLDVQAAEQPTPPVLRWGEVSLSSTAFVQAYRTHLTRSPGRDDLPRREAFARHLLEQHLIADRARALGLLEQPAIRRYLTRQRNWAMRRHFLQHHLGSPLPSPTEADVQEAFRRSNTRLRLQQLYAPDRATAEAWHQQLEAGASFDSLAAVSMQQQGLPPAQAGHLGWVTWNDMDLAPEDAAFALAPGEVSAPVASLRGWHLFRLLDREETVRVDGAAYANAREQLQFLLWQRRFDEASVRYVRALLESHDLVVSLQTLRAVWPDLAPLIPSSQSAPEIAAAAEATTALVPTDVDRQTPVAMVEGIPFTVGQFLDGLPDVPVAYWQPPLRQALEITIRDSILTAQARAHQADTARSVARHMDQVTRQALYQALVRRTADTLDLSRQTKAFYHRYRDVHFTTVRHTTFDAYPFPDSTTAWQALRRYQQTRDWPAAAQAFGSTPVRTTWPDTVRAGWSLHRVPLPEHVGRPLGPFAEADTWIVAVPHTRAATYAPLSAVQSEVEALMAQQRLTLTHEALLPAAYDPADVVVFEDNLRASLPFY